MTDYNTEKKRILECSSCHKRVETHEAIIKLKCMFCNKELITVIDVQKSDEATYERFKK